MALKHIMHVNIKGNRSKFIVGKNNNIIVLTNPRIFVGRLSNKFKYINISKIPKQKPKIKRLIEAK